MTIQLKTVCPEIIGRIPNGEYNVRDGSTAGEALCFCLESRGMEIPEKERLSTLRYAVNHHFTQPDTVLKDGDKLMVLRALTGG